MKEFLHNTWKHRAHVIMSLPAVLILFFFSYVPMAGLVLAFKDFDYKAGLWKSPWYGLENFKFLVASKATFTNLTKNTLFYYVLFTAIGTVLEIILAIAIDQLVFKKLGKVMQSIMIIPVFISFTAVQFIVYAYLNSDTGMVNNLFGLSTRWYMEAKYWPAILTIVKIWNGVGYGSVLYMSVLAGIDTQLYEAAEIDGAGFFAKFFKITLPQLNSVIVLNVLMAVTGALVSNYDIVNVMTDGGPHGATEVALTYIYRNAFKFYNMGKASAMSVILFGIALVFGIIQIVSMSRDDNYDN